MFLIKLPFVILTFVTGISLAACSDDNNTTAPTATAKANVLVDNASPDAKGVDLLVDNSITAQILLFQITQLIYR